MAMEGGKMSAPVTRIGNVGVLGHLDELERLMREYCGEAEQTHASTIKLSRELTLSGFLIWLRQRQRQSVVDARPVRNLSDVTRELDQQR